MRFGLILGLIIALMLAGGTAWAAEQVDFATEKFFSLGTTLDAANKLLSDEKRWEIGLRVDTPSVSRISCRYNGELIYMVEFYKGQCYSVEKRMVIPAAEAEPLFKQFHDQYGETNESTQDRENTLYYAHWYNKEREVELTIYEHQDGNYMAMLEDYQPEVRGEARSIMEQEIQQQPTEVDPITGKPRLIPPGEDDSAAPPEGQPDPNPPQETKPQDPKKKDKPKEDPKDPPKEPVEWDD